MTCQYALPYWGTGTAIMEVKLQQQLAWVDQEPLTQIYLDLRKAYDASGVMPRNLNGVRCRSKFALPPEEILGQCNDGVLRGW